MWLFEADCTSIYICLFSRRHALAPMERPRSRILLGPVLMSCICCLSGIEQCCASSAFEMGSLSDLERRQYGENFSSLAISSRPSAISTGDGHATPAARLLSPWRLSGDACLSGSAEGVIPGSPAVLESISGIFRGFFCYEPKLTLQSVEFLKYCSKLEREIHQVL
jgi:hypothetical protein